MIKEDEQEGITLICGHAYHHKCFVSNVKSYINRLEKDNAVNDNLKY